MSLDSIQIRELLKSDFFLGFLDVLSQLSHVGDVSYEQFCRTLVDRERLDIITLVAYDESRHRIVGTGSIHFDRKFLHNCSPAAYIEDVVVDSEYRNSGIGSRIVNRLIEIAKERMCYKVLLWCEGKNIDFYRKLGFYRTTNYIMRMDI